MPNNNQAFFWDPFSYTKKPAGQLAVQKGTDQVDGCPASFLGLSGNFSGISLKFLVF